MAENDQNLRAEGEAADRETVLRREYHAQTAKVRWHELQVAYARGRLVTVETGMNLVEVAVQLGLDNTAVFRDWIASGRIAHVSDELAEDWSSDDRELWAVVAPPWVLVQLT
ncbi:MAG: DUF2288 family protein [Pseudomonadota bacterium]